MEGTQPISAEGCRHGRPPASWACRTPHPPWDRGSRTAAAFALPRPDHASLRIASSPTTDLIKGTEITNHPDPNPYTATTKAGFLSSIKTTWPSYSNANGQGSGLAAPEPMGGGHLSLQITLLCARGGLGSGLLSGRGFLGEQGSASKTLVPPAAAHVPVTFREDPGTNLAQLVNSLLGKAPVVVGAPNSSHPNSEVALLPGL